MWLCVLADHNRQLTPDGFNVYNDIAGYPRRLITILL